MERPVSSGKDPESRDTEVNRPTPNGAPRELSCSHCRRIARYATALGIALNLPDAALVGLHRASALHGKGAITVITAVSGWSFGPVEGEGAQAGRAVPLALQIVSLVDRFDMLTTQGPDRRSCSTEAACDILMNEAARGRRSTPLVKAFVALARSRRLMHLRQDPGAN